MNATAQDFENFRDPVKKKDMFVYAAYLEPGMHKFVIYCPLSRRAYCKTMVVDVNTKDYYPEYPKQFVGKRRKLVMNMWRKSHKIDKNVIANVCSSDIDHDLFDLTFIIK